MLKSIFDSRLFRYLLVFLLGAAVGATGLHDAFAGMWHEFLTLIGHPHVGKPSVHVLPVIRETFGRRALWLARTSGAAVAATSASVPT